MLLYLKRANELINLKKENVNLQSNVIYIVEGQKTTASSVHFPASVRDLFITYFKSAKWQFWEREGNQEVFFWQEQKLTYPSLLKLLNSIARKANFNKRITVHQFRHTMATLMYNAGIDIAIIKRQLRHRQLETTLLYILPNTQEGELLEQYTNNNKYMWFR